MHESQNSDNGEYCKKLKNWFLSWNDLAIDCLHRAPQSTPGAKVKSGTYDYTLRATARGVLWAREARRGVLEAHSLALDCLAYAHEISGDEKYIRAGLRSLEAMLESPGFILPTPEGKPFAMTYRTWINFLGAAARLDLLQEWEYRH